MVVLKLLVIINIVVNVNAFIAGSLTNIPYSGPARYAASSIINNCTIYVIAGRSSGFGSELTTTETYNTATNTWTTVSSNAPGRDHATSTLINNKIYSIGGYDYNSNTIYNDVNIFTISTNTWSAVTTSGGFTARYAHSESLVGSLIYVIGGRSGYYLNDVWTFNTDTNAWASIPTFGTFTARGYHR